MKLETDEQREGRREGGGGERQRAPGRERGLGVEMKRFSKRPGARDARPGSWPPPPGSARYHRAVFPVCDSASSSSKTPVMGP